MKLQLLMKPADLDLHCFQKRVYNFEKKCYVHSVFIRLARERSGSVVECLTRD